MSYLSGALSLGTRKDAARWKEGCNDLGIESRVFISSPWPAMSDIKRFFSEPLGWIFIGAHYIPPSLLNDANNVDIVLRDECDGVDVTVGQEKAKLRKNDHTFVNHIYTVVIVWGVCWAFPPEGMSNTIIKFRKLFDNPLMLGFTKNTTAADISTIIDKGSIKRPNFFERLQGIQDLKEEDEVLVRVRDAWMETALMRYGKTEKASTVRAVDRDGQEWILRNNEKVKNRKFKI